MDWTDRHIAALEADHGGVPPPWWPAPDSHPLSIDWRWGGGEAHLDCFSRWWSRVPWDEAARVVWLQRWPPPPRWLAWVAVALWGRRPGAGPADLERLRALGFAGVDDHARDFDDPRWLPEE